MKLRKIGMILGVAASLVAGSTFAADADFMLVNKTGYSIRQIYISSENNDWGNNRIDASATLENNRLRFVKFSDKASCKRDVKAVFDDATEATWKGLDLCKVDKLSLKYDRNTKQVAALKE